jgi:hypothetical protein
MTTKSKMNSNESSIAPAEPGWTIDQIRDEEGHVVAEIGRCTDPECQCAGSIVYWDDRE